MPTQPTNNSSYLSKIISLLIRKGGGSIRIPAQDLYEDDIGSGFQVHFDYQTKELVLTHVPAGAKIFEIKENQSWLTPENSPLSNNGPRNSLNVNKQPLTPDQLISKIWTDSAGTPTLEEEAARRSQVSQSKVRVLTTEGMAEAELRRREEQVVREITDYQSPQPPYRPPSRRQEPPFSPPLTMFSKR